MRGCNDSIERERGWWCDSIARDCALTPPSNNPPSLFRCPPVFRPPLRENDSLLPSLRNILPPLRPDRIEDSSPARWRVLGLVLRDSLSLDKNGLHYSVKVRLNMRRPRRTRQYCLLKPASGKGKISETEPPHRRGQGRNSPMLGHRHEPPFPLKKRLENVDEWNFAVKRGVPQGDSGLRGQHFNNFQMGSVEKIGIAAFETRAGPAAPDHQSVAVRRRNACRFRQNIRQIWPASPDEDHR